ncbi:MAG: hypothetical protein P1U58_00525 [Verrucomicrobiales bacterium]|nr:hypothetical protein [Verrucomicrobiales bacterium]
MSDHEPDLPEDSGSNASPDPSSRVVIPDVLHSFYEERPFVSCTRCGESLKDFAEGFRISKSFKGDEVILESAMCMPCMAAMMDETSDESKLRLEEFHEKHYRDVSGFDECALCENTLDQVKDDEFNLVGVCQGNDMLDSALICFDCQEAMNEIISEETRRTWERFRQENFPGVPSDFEPMPTRPAPISF